MPPVPEYKVNQIVKYEIQQQIPFSLDQIAMDYQVLSRTEAGGYEVMMAAIKVEVVDKHIDIIQKRAPRHRHRRCRPPRRLQLAQAHRRIRR
ncbi:MAG: pilus assembly protein PilM [Candidatus Competibacteraceae bacterium]|nr:pilus assembly protein PilM [Candidatus Competibacteraceae bacterium]